MVGGSEDAHGTQDTPGIVEACEIVVRLLATATGLPPHPGMSDAIWVCIDCGARQPAEGACVACRNEMTADTRMLSIRELMHDVDLRLAQRREGRLRFVGVGLGMLVVGLAWMIPGYWRLRGAVYPGLPFFFDQWGLMALTGYGVTVGLERLFRHKRFPYLDDNLNITS
jgi:hypothetical protein